MINNDQGYCLTYIIIICIINLSLHSSSSLSSSSRCEKWNHIATVWSVIWNHWVIRFPKHSAIVVDGLFWFSTLRLTKGKLQSHCQSSSTIWISKSAYITYKSFTKHLVLLDSCDSASLPSPTHKTTVFFIPDRTWQ